MLTSNQALHYAAKQSSSWSEPLVEEGGNMTSQGGEKEGCQINALKK